MEITKYFVSKPRLNDGFSRDDLPWIKNGVYIINLCDKQSKGMHWFSLFIDRNTAVLFDSFAIEYIPEDMLNKMKNKSLNHKSFRIRSDVLNFVY